MGDIVTMPCAGHQKMKIEYLADYTAHVPTLAKWFHDEWGYGI